MCRSAFLRCTRWHMGIALPRQNLFGDGHSRHPNDLDLAKISRSFSGEPIAVIAANS